MMGLVVSEDIDLIAGALVSAQPSIGQAIEELDCSAVGDLSAALRVTRQPLAENGLAAVQAPVTGESGIVSVSTRLLHESGQFLQTNVSLLLNETDTRAVREAIAALKVVGLCALLGVPTTDDLIGTPHVRRDGGHAAATSGKSSESVQLAESRSSLRQEMLSHVGGSTEAAKELLEKLTLTLGRPPKRSTVDMTRDEIAEIWAELSRLNGSQPPTEGADTDGRS